MNDLSEEKMLLLADAFALGYSRARAAKYAGVAIRTGVKYREFGILGGMELPTVCGCGRPIKHMGRCQYRRKGDADAKVS